MGLLLIENVKLSSSWVAISRIILVSFYFFFVPFGQCISSFFFFFCVFLLNVFFLNCSFVYNAEGIVSQETLCLKMNTAVTAWGSGCSAVDTEGLVIHVRLRCVRRLGLSHQQVTRLCGHGGKMFRKSKAAAQLKEMEPFQVLFQVIQWLFAVNVVIRENLVHRTGLLGHTHTYV